MKETVKVVLVAAFTCLSMSIIAQQSDKKATHEVPSPEGMARHITEQMKRVVQLNETQYKKIYKLNLNEQRKLFKQQQAQQKSGEGAENRPPMGGPGGDMGGGMPPMGDGDFGGGMPQGDRNSDSQSFEEKAAAAKKIAEHKDKKLKKVLTSDQFSKWKAFEAEQLKNAPKKGMEPKGKLGERPVNDND